MKKRIYLLTVLLAGLALVLFRLNSDAGRTPKGREIEFTIADLAVRYHGDSPSFRGTVGPISKEDSVALGDPIYQRDAEVGKITHLEWDRPRAQLTVEFDPIDHAKLAVGDRVWLRRGGRPLEK